MATHINYTHANYFPFELSQKAAFFLPTEWKQRGRFGAAGKDGQMPAPARPAVRAPARSLERWSQNHTVPARVKYKKYFSPAYNNFQAIQDETTATAQFRTG